MEAFHVVATHPQLLAGIGDANSQYDVFGNFSRAITANGTPSPHLGYAPTEQEMFDAMTDRRLDEPPAFELPDGVTARQAAATGARMQLAPVIGEDAADELCDAELVDSFYYTVFPNFHPWGAYNRIVYRFRPERRPARRVDHGVHVPVAVRRRRARRRRRSTGSARTTTGPTRPSSASSPACSTRTRSTCRRCSCGLRTMVKPGVTLALYQETKIRHFHRLLERQLGLDL